MTDMFWDVATSAAVLSIIGVVLVGAVVIAHLPGFVERIWPEAEAYGMAAALVQAIAAGLLCFLIGFRASDERAENASLKNEVAYRQVQIETAEETAKDAERLKEEAEAKAAEAKGKLNDFRKKFGASDGCGWTDDEFDGLRNLRGAKR
ncbi:hypothetical protein I6F35_33690 [Bradyrhizobium sp. BRP22]|uniref:hypothetical protein n=1 Tax=Bradyrhizobium sp. BRP22 TaxID=2793821 RepID=UPI001CD5DF87|nr:hypothetical protein [Bradyrhizobium sp. BRP22]MCA1458089.1 hypothetical protein [Bradyrhizobium sp. BRP22]